MNYSSLTEIYWSWYLNLWILDNWPWKHIIFEKVHNASTLIRRLSNYFKYSAIIKVNLKIPKKFMASFKNDRWDFKWSLNPAGRVKNKKRGNLKGVGGSGNGFIPLLKEYQSGYPDKPTVFHSISHNNEGVWQTCWWWKGRNWK